MTAMTERNVEVLVFFSHVQTMHSKEGPAKLGFSGRPPGIPGLSPSVVKIVIAQVEVDEGRRGLQKHRNGLAKNETWPFASIRQSIWTKRWWYENQDGHPVSTKKDQEREDKSDNGRACATVAEMIQCSSFQKIYLNSPNNCDNASIEDPSTETLS